MDTDVGVLLSCAYEMRFAAEVLLVCAYEMGGEAPSEACAPTFLRTLRARNTLEVRRPRFSKHQPGSSFPSCAFVSTAPLGARLGSSFVSAAPPGARLGLGSASAVVSSFGMTKNGGARRSVPRQPDDVPHTHCVNSVDRLLVGKALELELTDGPVIGEVTEAQVALRAFECVLLAQRCAGGARSFVHVVRLNALWADDCPRPASPG